MLWRKMPQPEREPIARIFNAILKHAICDEVRDIRIELCEGVSIPDSGERNKAVVVSYLFGHEWREQMAMPIYVQPALLAHIRELAAMNEAQNTGEIEMSLRDESDDFHLTLRVAVEIKDDEIVALRWQFSVPETTNFSP